MIEIFIYFKLVNLTWFKNILSYLSIVEVDWSLMNNLPEYSRMKLNRHLYSEMK